MTPMRTPQRTLAGNGDAIMMEAENLARLRDSQTPLLGGENPELHPSDFSGVTPRKKDIQTPNPMLTPSMTPGGAGLTPRIGLTPSRDGSSFSMTPKGTPFRDELHINEDMDMHESAKLEKQRREEARRSLRSGLTGLPQPKNEYQIVAQPPPEESEEPEEKIEEDMSDRIAREKAEEEARQQALLRKRSKVLQRDLPRPPAASLKLIRSSLLSADGDNSSVVPPTPIEVADKMIRTELLQLLEHDNAKYPLDDKAEKKKGVKNRTKGSVSEVLGIEDFEENELQEADRMIKEEGQILCVAMGHENESLDDFVEAHNTCVNDLMYFPTRNAYGLSSVAGNADKVAALQVEMENVRKKLEEDEKKAEHMKTKYKTYTKGHEKRAETVWSQIEASLKQIEIGGTEVECFKALKRQEEMAASFRKKNLEEEVAKQKETERKLQERYGNLLSILEKAEEIMVGFRAESLKQEVVEDSHKVKEATLATGEEEDVAIAMEASA